MFGTVGVYLNFLPRFVREEYEKKLESQRKGYETEIKRVNHEKDKVNNENHYLRAELEHYKNRQQHMDSDDKVQEKLISFDSRLSQSNFSGKTSITSCPVDVELGLRKPKPLFKELARMSSASYNSNNHHDGLYQESSSGTNHHRLKSQASSTTKIPHLRSVQNLRDFQVDLSPGRAPTKNAGDLKKQKRMLESVYDDYIEKIRGPSD